MKTYLTVNLKNWKHVFHHNDFLTDFKRIRFVCNYLAFS